MIKIYVTLKPDATFPKFGFVSGFTCAEHNDSTYVLKSATASIGITRVATMFLKNHEDVIEVEAKRDGVGIAGTYWKQPIERYDNTEEEED